MGGHSHSHARLIAFDGISVRAAALPGRYEWCGPACPAVTNVTGFAPGEQQPIATTAAAAWISVCANAPILLAVPASSPSAPRIVKILNTPLVKSTSLSSALGCRNYRSDPSTCNDDFAPRNHSIITTVAVIYRLACPTKSPLVSEVGGKGVLCESPREKRESTGSSWHWA